MTLRHLLAHWIVSLRDHQAGNRGVDQHDRQRSSLTIGEHSILEVLLDSSLAFLLTFRTSRLGFGPPSPQVRDPVADQPRLA